VGRILVTKNDVDASQFVGETVMAEQKMIIGIGLPLILLLAMLMLFGVTWLFHHHHWRPFAGIFLFVIGTGFFLLLMGRATFQVAPQMVTSAPYDPRGMNSNAATNSKTETIRQGTYVDGITAERSDPSTGTMKPAEKSAAAIAPSTDSTTKTAEHPPDWVSRPPHHEDRDNGQRVYVATAKSGRYSTESECQWAIIPAVNEIVAGYAAAEHLSDARDGDLTLDVDYIRSELITGWYWEPVDTSVGPMHQLHALLVFDSRVRNEIDSRARLAKVDGRLKYAAAGTALTLLVLGGVYSLLRKRESGTSAAAK
jgi:hypothetical protein